MSTAVPRRCHHCGSVLGSTVWYASALPWIYCSPKCLREYFGKDGETEVTGLKRSPDR